MPRKIRLDEPELPSQKDAGYDAADELAAIFDKTTRRALEQEKLLTEIAEQKARRAKIEHSSKGWGIQRAARRGMLGLAALLSFGAVGDAIVPDTEEYIYNANPIELAIFHNETNPIELLGLTIPLFGGAAYRRKKKDRDVDDD